MGWEQYLDAEPVPAPAPAPAPTAADNPWASYLEPDPQLPSAAPPEPAMASDPRVIAASKRHPEDAPAWPPPPTARPGSYQEAPVNGDVFDWLQHAAPALDATDPTSAASRFMASPIGEKTGEMAPWVMGPLGLAAAAGTDTGSRFESMRAGGHGPIASALGAAGQLAVDLGGPALAGKVLGPVARAAGGRVADALGGPVGDVVGAGVEHAATGAGTGGALAVGSAGVSAASGDYDRAQQELASAGDQALLLGALGGATGAGAHLVGAAGHGIADALAPEAAPEPADPFLRWFGQLAPEDQAAVVEAARTERRQAMDTARARAEPSPTPTPMGGPADVPAPVERSDREPAAGAEPAGPEGMVARPPEHPAPPAGGEPAPADRAGGAPLEGGLARRPADDLASALADAGALSTDHDLGGDSGTAPLEQIGDAMASGNHEKAAHHARALADELGRVAQSPEEQAVAQRLRGAADRLAPAAQEPASLTDLVAPVQDREGGLSAPRAEGVAPREDAGFMPRAKDPAIRQQQSADFAGGEPAPTAAELHQRFREVGRAVGLGDEHGDVAHALIEARARAEGVTPDEYVARTFRGKGVEVGGEAPRSSDDAAILEQPGERLPAVSAPHVPEGFNTTGKDDPEAHRFVRAPGGGVDWGRIAPDVAREIRRQAGPIRLQVGWHGGPGVGFGLVHLRHGEKFLGRDLALLHQVLRDYDAIYADDGRLVLVKHGNARRPDGAFVELVPGDHYSVITAYGIRPNKLKGSPLWTRSTTRDRTPRPEVPGLPDSADEGRGGPPKAAQQSDDAGEPTPPGQADNAPPQKPSQAGDAGKSSPDVLAQSAARDGDMPGQQGADFAAGEPKKPGPVWTTKTAELLKDPKFPAKATGDAMLAFLRNKGVNDREAFWLGLDTLRGKKQVTRDEVAALAQPPEIIERVNGGENYAKQREADDNVTAWGSTAGEARGDLVRAMREDNGDNHAAALRMADAVRDGLVKADSLPSERQRRIARRMIDAFRTHQMAIEERNKIEKKAGRPKYGDYTLPGGENYRELLMTAPAHGDLPSGYRVVENPYQGTPDRSRFIVEGPGEPNGVANRYSSGRTREDAIAAFKKHHAKNEVYTSPHWPDVLNPLLHVRFNERTDADGKRVLHVEEIQSDWHQAGREHGYLTPERVAELKNKQAEYDAFHQRIKDGLREANDIVDQQRALTDQWNRRNPGRLPLESEERWRTSPEYAEIERLSEAYRAMEARQNDLSQQARDLTNPSIERGRLVPEAPFAKTWEEIGFRRMVRWAAEHGFERVTWTTGEQQVERYDLAKQVHSIEWRPFDNAERAQNAGKDGWLTIHDRHGERIADEPKSLADVEALIGKDAANRLIRAPAQERTGGGRTFNVHRLSGENLRIGGEGMKAAYDQRLVSIAKAMGKKFGAEVGTTRILTAPEGKSPLPWVVYDENGDEYIRATSEREAREMRDRYIEDTAEREDWSARARRETEEAMRIEHKPIHGFESVHSLDLSPKLVESALEGQPLAFQRKAGEVRGLVDFRDPDGTERAVIRIFKTADGSTLFHELGHVFRRQLRGEDLATVERWAGAADGRWSREAEEKWATGFERYLRDGKAPTEPLRAVFRRLRDWLVDVYRRLKGSSIDVKLPDDVRAVMDRLLTGPEDQLAEPTGAAPAREPDVIDAIKELGGLRRKPADYVGGEYDAAPKALATRRAIAGTEAPDVLAMRLRDERGIGDGTVNGMWDEVATAERARAAGPARAADEPTGDSAPAMQGPQEAPRIRSAEDERLAEEIDAHAHEVLGHGAGPRERLNMPDAGGRSPTSEPTAEIKQALYGTAAEPRGFLRNDVVRPIRAVVDGVVSAAKDLRDIFSPASNPIAKPVSLILREMGGELAQREDRARAKLAQASTFFDKIGWDKSLDFIDRMERGERQPTPVLEKMAATIRTMLDSTRDEIRALGTGKLERFIVDYFPHLWEKPDQAASVFARLFGKRPAEGPKSFLKKRSIPTTKEGIELGLTPVSKNPIDLVLLKLREMNRYLLFQRAIKEMDEIGLRKFHSVNDGKLPEGWGKVNDRAFEVYAPPTITVPEHVDKAVLAPLRAVLDNLGVKHERKASAGRGALGYSVQGADEIVTKGGTELGVLAHELGHQLDHRFGLGERVNAPDLDDETRALADLHGGKEDYFRTPKERTASVLEAYVQARERMREVAPKTLKMLEGFIDEHPELAPLKAIKPSLEYEKIEHQRAHGGVLKMGDYIVPTPVARLIANHLSPGLRGKAWYNAISSTSNMINRVQLGFSGFHLGFTSFDAITSRDANAVDNLLAGKLATAGKREATALAAPVTNALLGRRLRQEWDHPGTTTKEIAQLVDAMKAGGGRARMDSLYRVAMADNMTRALRQGNFLGAALRLPFATLDAPSKVIMEHVVPLQKMGIFADMARLELDKLGPKATRMQLRDAMAKAWDSVDNRLGEVVYDNLFWNKIAKDLGHITVRSLGWNLGTIRELGGGLYDTLVAGKKLTTGQRAEWTRRMSYTLVALPLRVALFSAVYQYLATGQGPQELRDYFFPKTGEKDEKGHDVRLSWPSYMKDVYAYAHDPKSTLKNKVNPLWQQVWDMLANKDFHGEKIRNEDDPLIQQALDVLKHFRTELAPFSTSNARDPNLGIGDKVGGFFGVQRAPKYLSMSDAENLATEIRQQSATDQDVGTFQRHEEARPILRDLRAQEPAQRSRGIQAIHDQVAAGKMTVDQAKRLIVQASTTALQFQVRDMPIADAMRVWRVATPQERAEIRGEVAGKLVQSRSISEDARARFAKMLTEAEVAPTAPASSATAGR